MRGTEGIVKMRKNITRRMITKEEDEVISKVTKAKIIDIGIKK